MAREGVKREEKIRFSIFHERKGSEIARARNQFAIPIISYSRRKRKHCRWMDNKSRDGYADAFTGCIIQGRIAKETFTFRDFIIVQFVSRDKKRRDTPTGEYWTRNRCSRQPFRVGFQTFDFGVNLRWRLRRKQWTSFTSHQSIALVTNLYIYI